MVASDRYVAVQLKRLATLLRNRYPLCIIASVKKTAHIFHNCVLQVTYLPITCLAWDNAGVSWALQHVQHPELRCRLLESLESGSKCTIKLSS